MGGVSLQGYSGAGSQVWPPVHGALTALSTRDTRLQRDRSLRKLTLDTQPPAGFSNRLDNELCFKQKVKVAQSYPTLCDPMDYTVHGILQARILEWEAFPFSRGSSQPRDPNPGLLHCRWILYQLSHQGSPRILEWVVYPFSSRSSRPKNRTGVSCIAGRFFTS